MADPTRPPVGDLLTGNVRAIARSRRELARRRTRAQRIADAVTAFLGSMTSVVAHAVAFGTWLVANTGGVPGVTPWDPFPFVMLAMIASIEAIFLTTFVLISQNRMSTLADERAELDLQVGLLSEHELTRLIALVDEVAKHLDVHRPAADELESLKEVVGADVLEHAPGEPAP